MKNLYEAFVPGDLIEFVYDRDDKLVDNSEKLWSSTMKQFVKIGGAILFVCQDEQSVWMLTKDGFIHARINDASGAPLSFSQYRVHPRAVLDRIPMNV